MAQPAAAPAPQGAPWGFLFLAVVIHFFDVLMRYGTTPVDIGGTPGSPGLWVLFLFMYGVLFLFANNLPALSGMSRQKLLLVSLVAYVWGPLWSILPGFMPALKYVAALFILIAPFWLIVMFYATQSFPRLSLVYSVIWLFLVTFALFPNIRDFAEQQGHPLPDSLNPGSVLAFSWEKIKESSSNFYQYFFVSAPKKIGSEVERQLAIATGGDYYTGKVDSAAKQRLGVYLENFRSADAVLYENAPVTAYATMRAETLDRELPIMLNCLADGNLSGTVRPQATFTILTSDVIDIDCTWPREALKKGSHALTLRTEFEFTTRAYQKSYIMDQERLREYRRQNVDPLKDIPDKNPIAIYTSGPVRIGMGTGQQPIALGKSGDPLQSWGVTIENAWEGKVLEISRAFFFTPIGIEVDDPIALGMVKSSCDRLTLEDHAACEDTLVNVYELTQDELRSPLYKNLTLKSFRIPLKVANPSAVLGQAPIAVQNFKAMVEYRYLLERSTTVSVREVPKV